METSTASSSVEGKSSPGPPEGTMEQEQQTMLLLPQERKKIRAMVAIDDSEESFYALKWALDKIFNHINIHETMPPADPRVEDSSLVSLVHVMDTLPHYAFPGGYVVESATKAQEQNAAKILSRASQMCKDRKVPAETLILEGDPKEMICQAVERMYVDVLVVGSRGLGQIKRAFLGSVSDYCAHHAKCPVVIVKLPKESRK
ncbi:hypothetical protein ACH5RR_004447 [Cinchona calisaya]|uniref:UspA domain-containing protein n=1 Tax=Cinchona calisaya TaxID=153742 RepID=A0ABD3AY16_9GENT